MLCVKTANVASVGMEKDVTEFTSQIYVPLKKSVERNIVVTKDILTYVTILKSLENANFKITVSTCTWKVLKKLQKEIEILKTEILHLKIRNEKLERKITHVYENHFHKSGQTDDIVRSY